MQYGVVVCDSAKNLVDLVNQFLKEGWELQGGVSITQSTNGILKYAQAIIK